MLIEKEACLDLILTCIIPLWVLSLNDWCIIHINLISFLSALMITWFSRTCFKPFGDYIDAYDNINMIEALGIIRAKQPSPIDVPREHPP